MMIRLLRAAEDWDKFRCGAADRLVSGVLRTRSARSRHACFCRVGPGFHPEPLTDPDLILSHHPARAIARRLPPSTERRAPPGEPSWPKSAAMTRPLRSSPITGPSLLLRGSPPLSGASVLSASRLEPLA